MTDATAVDVTRPRRRRSSAVANLGGVTSPTVVVLDYGSGNLRSAERALARAGADVTVTADPHAARGGRRPGRAGRRRVRGLHGRAARGAAARR